MHTTKLIPVDQWTYDLYKVEYWTENAADGGCKIKTIHLTASCDNHLQGDIDRHTPNGCGLISWDRVKENVGHPRVVGNLYGHPVHETSYSHGQRLAGAAL